MSETYFPKLPSGDGVRAAEEATIEWWQREDTFRRSVDERPASNPFVFYEGPPTANGRPGVHHGFARLTKDLVCRFKTMQGHQVVRKAGWDTHGLPVEIEVENQLGIKHKEEIEAYGVAEFNARCRESVFRYEKDWVEFTSRIGFWVDMDDPYITFKNEYIESVWWILKEFWKKGLIYQGHKIVPYCPRCETSLSSHEVSQGYKDVKDPSIFVKFQREDADEKFLVWTTTPWTLISNMALAVGAEHTYARVRHNDETYVLAEALLAQLDGDYEVIGTVVGADLVGATYIPLFDYYADKKSEGAFRVVAGDFVSLDDGTGIVHIAPAFGEDDYQLHRNHGVPLVQAVAPNGTFLPEIEPWAGQFIKDADTDITKHLKVEGKLYKNTKITHSYPFCWRCSTPLVYYARKSWYIETTSYKDEMIAASAKVNWIPREVGEYRFGNWLENNVDWSLSRERYWGTPLNIWRCECGHDDTVGGIDELYERAVNPPARDDLDLHRPMVDDIKLKCDKCAGEMERVKEVIDVWFDSGAMPFAQYHHPWDENKMFDRQFPADYISEGIDQSRGWFYSLLAISVFLTGKSPYKNVLSTELILDKNGQKMSKSRGNAVDPWDVLNNEGADALRWYLITASPPWTPTRFDRDGVVESSQKLMGTLRNVYSFFAMYANIDGYVHGDDQGEPNLLDRWLLSRYHSLVADVTENMNAYDPTRAGRAIQAFVLDELSNWYVRRSRRRFWKGEAGPDKVAAYHTLYTVLDGVAKLLAPFTPFIAEEVFLALRGATVADASKHSIHLQDFPVSDATLIDTTLEQAMDIALRVSSMGRSVRNDASVRVRQPLANVWVHGEGVDGFLAEPDVVALAAEELNVRNIAKAKDLGESVSLTAKPNFPVLGKRFGKQVPQVASAIKALDAGALLAFEETGAVTVNVAGEDVQLGTDELTVGTTGRTGFGAVADRGLTVVMDLTISEELKLEGLAREVINRVQNLRKSAGLDVTDRIELRYRGSAVIDKVFSTQGDLIRNETLATEIAAGDADWEHRISFAIDDEEVSTWLQKVG